MYYFNLNYTALISKGKAKAATLILLVVCCSLNSFGQVPEIKTPQPATMTPNVVVGSGSTTPTPNVPNVPNYNTRGKTMQQINMEIIENDVKMVQAREAAMKNVYNDLNTNNYKFSFPSHQGFRGVDSYSQAFNEFERMLSGQEPLSIKRAEFIKENAYYENTLSYDSYCKIIDNIAYLCELQMQKDNLPNTDLAKNMTIYKFMADTITVDLPGQEKTFTHYPMKYDFEDYWGDEVWEKTFITKLLMTETGQCLSMPRLFLILSEELESEAYLALSPNHSYVKIPIGRDRWQNIELTSGLLSSDAFVMESGYVKSASIENRIYMDTLGTKKVVATSLLEMANGYLFKYGYDDFYIKCVELGLKYHQNNIVGLINKSNYYNAKMKYIVDNNPYLSKENISQYPEAYEAYLQADSSYFYLKEVGHERIPREVYEEWRNSGSEKESQESCKMLQQSIRNIK